MYGTYVLFTHCCDSKARQHSPKGLPKATKEFEVRSINIGYLQRCHCTVAHRLVPCAIERALSGSIPELVFFNL